jgi:putative SOS response-associated peptidase YedK
MCNLYSITRNQEAIRRLFRVMRDLTGNLPPLPAVYPDTMAPIVRLARDGERELSMMRWGFPPPPNLGSVPVTNVRNLKSPYWRGWLKAEWRCLIPATSFCEWTDSGLRLTKAGRFLLSPASGAYGPARGRARPASIDSSRS